MKSVKDPEVSERKECSTFGATSRQLSRKSLQLLEVVQVLTNHSSQALDSALADSSIGAQLIVNGM